MKTETYMLVKETPIVEGSLKGFTEINQRRLVYMPADSNEFNKTLNRYREDLKPGECFKFYKVSIGKRYYQVEAAE